MALPNPAIPVHGDIEKVSGLRLKQGPNEDTGRIVDTAGGRPPSQGIPTPTPAPPSSGQSGDTFAYVKAIAAKANADRWVAVAQSSDDPEVQLLAQAAVAEARRIWREARQGTAWYPEADL